MEISSIRQLQAMARARRLQLNLSQEGLAEAAGLSRKWVSEFERGKSTIELALVFQLLTALDLRIQVAAAGAQEAERATPQHMTDAVDLGALLDEHLAS